MEGKAILKALDEKKHFEAVWKLDDWETAEALEEEHNAPYRALYSALVAGKIDAFDWRGVPGADGYMWYIATRSVRPGVLVQLSVAWVRDGGELVPMSHRDISDVGKFLEDVPARENAVHWYIADSAVA